MFGRYLLVGAYALLGIALSTGSGFPRPAPGAGPDAIEEQIRAEEDDGTSEEDKTDSEGEDGIYDEDIVLA